MSFNDELSKLLPTSFDKKGASSAPKKPQQTSSSGGDMDWDSFRSMMPATFGKQEEKKDLKAHFAKTKRTEENAEDNDGEPAPSEAQEDHDDDDDDDDDDNDDNDQNAEGSESENVDQADSLPISHEIKLLDHHKVGSLFDVPSSVNHDLYLPLSFPHTVSALALDPSGARLVSGSYDYDVKFWDFAGMDASLRPFRSIEPMPGHQSNGRLVPHRAWVIQGQDLQSRWVRDEFAKGDPYIRDMRNTELSIGHMNMIFAGKLKGTNVLPSSAKSAHRA
ncbi:LOW QUALITY PROTEIN: hypothetical protein BC938DRAFT_483042 [Jimgerdemannia flammicorona]|uniref:Uncharacterized protein n=1 Tax=Jimgerdemannia flammicorona TaxID=994334 RepID=A0A433QCP9_9FUNG|nr:LOW QUALITY PROTEIN: hypothetical protein BC938DRAFT_483042 [Jimgerdemannia flammicorona]